MIEEKIIDCFIVGAQKAGTSSIIQYLAQHPAIMTSGRFEFNFFYNPEYFEGDFDKAFTSFFQKDSSLRSFTVSKNILMYNEEGLRRLYTHNPNVKIIIILREPVKRAFSSFLYARRKGWETISEFKEAIVNDSPRDLSNPLAQVNCEYLDQSDYFKYVKLVFQVFPEKNVKILILEEIKNDLNAALNELVDFMGLPEHKFETNIKHNSYSKSRFKLLTKYGSPGKKMWIKKFLPHNFRIKIKALIENINDKKENPPELSLEDYEFAAAKLKNSRKQLEILLGTEIKAWDPI